MIPNDIAFHSHLRDIEPVKTRSCDMKIVLAVSATLICQRHLITARCQLLVPCSYLSFQDRLAEHCLILMA